MCFFTSSTSRKPQLKRIAYYPKCMVMKFHRKEHVEFDLNASEKNGDFDVRDKKYPPNRTIEKISRFRDARIV